MMRLVDPSVLILAPIVISVRPGLTSLHVLLFCFSYCYMMSNTSGEDPALEQIRYNARHSRADEVM